MPEETSNKKIYIILAVIILAIIGAGSVYFLTKNSGGLGNIIGTTEKPKVIEETLVIPDTQKVTATEGRFVKEGDVNVPLMPKSEGEKVIVAKAVLTVKGSHDLAVVEAKKWASDALPVFVKSLGAVTLEGKSSQWQLVFVSKSKTQKGYEVIIQADQIVSKKEIDSNAIGAELPNNLKDSSDSIKMLQELPQFSDTTISSITLYYNVDGKIWRYALSTSKGTTSTLAQ